MKNLKHWKPMKKNNNEYISALLDRRIELLKLYFNGLNTDKTKIKKYIDINKKETGLHLYKLGD